MLYVEYKSDKWHFLKRKGWVTFDVQDGMAFMICAKMHKAHFPV